MYNSTAHFVSQGLIGDQTLDSFNVLLKLVLNPIIGIMGLCANLINIVVYYKMGLNDGVSQNFFILSISDGCLVTTSIIGSVAYIFYTEVYVGLGGPEYQAQVIYNVSILIGIFPSGISMVTTAVIAVVRCLCVAMPLRVKILMTARRQLAVILAYSTYSASFLIYAYSPARVALVENPLRNSSFILIADLNWLELTVASNVSSYLSFMVVIICVIVLAISLKRSSKFRKTSTGVASTSVSASNQTKDSTKETRVIKTVLFVSIVFIVSYLPAVSLTLIGTLVKEFSIDGIYRNANQLNLMVMELFSNASATVNIFIYYFCNTRYRSTFNKLFRKQTKEANN